VIIDLWERLESACSESRRECEVWDSDWGSVVERDERGRVESRFRYVAVVGSFEDGGGRGDGLSK